MHLTGGLLFILSGLGHLAYNGKIITSVLKNALKAKGFKPSWPLAAALVLNLFVYAGTAAKLPPMEFVISSYKSLKQGGGPANRPGGL